MEYLQKFYAIIYRKGYLHYKLIQVLFPDKSMKSYSFFNPLSIIYILGLDIEFILWYNLPIYFVKRKLSIPIRKKAQQLNVGISIGPGISAPIGMSRYDTQTWGVTWKDIVSYFNR